MEEAKKILLPIVIAFAIILAVGLLIQRVNQSSPQGLKNILRVENKKEVVLGGSVAVEVEVARSDQERQKGLSGRTELEKDSGMLFVFDQMDIRPSFWMKDMRFAIDIIWINDGRIVKIDESVPAPATNTPDNELALYQPGSVIDYVLEVNAGFSEEKGLEVGGTVDLSKAL